MKQKEFDQLFHDYYTVLCRYAERMVDDSFVVEELVQDVFVRLWKGGKEQREIHILVAYLYRATRNACLNHLRSQQRSGNKVAPLVPEMTEDVIEEQDILRGELLRELYHAMDTLPAIYGEVLKRTYEQGIPSKKIAEELGISITAVDQRRAKGIQLLRGIISKDAFILLVAGLLQ